MTLITVNVPHELRERLKKEENQSGLITELLERHFKTNLNGGSSLTKKILHEQVGEYQKLIEEKSEIIEKLENVVKKQITEEEKKAQEEQFKQNVADRIKNARMNTFKEFAGRDMTEEEYTLFVKKWDSEDNFTMFDFIKIVAPESAPHE